MDPNDNALSPQKVREKRRCPYGQSESEFDRLVAIETDLCVEWPYATNAKGYGKLNRRGKALDVHRLALLRRVGEPPNPTDVAAHGPCHNPRCMNYRHLTWASVAQNAADRRRDGTGQDGEANASAVLTTSDVVAIRSSAERLGVLATRHGVSEATISKIRNRRSWRHVPDHAPTRK